ncbi:MAG: tetratricopeptide repeat protein, partial [Verrucomicrobia bacterium]|nr:tetratricopeptide repeat protein [Verrucomicrobiota bacterium]
MCSAGGNRNGRVPATPEVGGTEPTESSAPRHRSRRDEMVLPRFAGENPGSRARFELGDLDGAIADLTESMRHSPLSEVSRMNRGYFRWLKGDLPGAIADFRAIIESGSGNINRRNSVCHAACWLYWIESERGQNRAAEELAQTMEKVDRLGPTGGPKIWYRLEADLLLGRITEEQLIAKVAVPADRRGDSNRFQALFFTAQLRRRAGDEAGALERFRRALQIPNAPQFQPDW